VARQAGPVEKYSSSGVTVKIDFKGIMIFKLFMCVCVCVYIYIYIFDLNIILHCFSGVKTINQSRDTSITALQNHQGGLVNQLQFSAIGE